MITKQKTMQFIASDGTTHDNIESAKICELKSLIGNDNEVDIEAAFTALVSKPREAIAILRLGLPRKPRTVKPKTVKAKKAAVPSAV